MVDRFLVWMSTGLVTVGVTAAVVAGAGVAMATDGDPTTAAARRPRNRWIPLGKR